MKKQKPKNVPRKVQLKEAAAVPSVYDKFDIDILAVAYNVIPTTFRLHWTKLNKFCFLIL